MLDGTDRHNFFSLTAGYKLILRMFVCLFVCLGFNGIFSTNRLYCAM